MEDNKDYYIENGFYVFTEQYHLKRGYCCKSGCRHCPWSYKKKINKSESQDIQDFNIKNKK
jgi:Family of unknown function (DUF5522)